MAKAIFRFGLAMVIGTAAVGCKEEPVAVTNPATNPVAASTQPAAAPAAPTAGPATLPTSTDAAPASGSGNDGLFTLPPSKGPAAHAFKQVTLLRSGVSGDLEMQLTGDGIYRVRDHGHGQSYSGSGKLEEAQIAEWATLMKDWESLKDSYVPTPAPDNADKVDIMYGGKKVSFSTAGKENPAVVSEVYKRLLALNEQSKKESGAVGTSGQGEK
ncbi:hypothetical protein [Humisphaera borealis]|uniref:Uncharacterized protein n=1 Tax=Humisphaera borealis TaxID=2807512 RepID=A0A7M2X2Q3_9BACT|nr:hypothetical protein [Humisphaera borealis]QOV91965.1 hypothetical protein IPV69_11665 [Humisphaera borealis]